MSLQQNLPGFDSLHLRAERNPVAYDGESKAYLSEQLITYIGNKRKLLPLIQEAILSAIEKLGKDTISFADVFAGTGAVSRLARRWSHILYINDLEKYSAYSSQVYQSNASKLDLEKIENARHVVNNIAAHNPQSGFITELYSPSDEQDIQKYDRVFYTRRNAMFIDTARREIDRLDDEIQPYILAPLLQRASVHVNTSGVFKGFYKNTLGIGQFGGTMRNALQRIVAPIVIPKLIFSKFERDVYIFNKESADFVSSLPSIDVAYFDPPYNQHPYGSNYFMLNLILKNIRPEGISRVSGIPSDWNRSDFNVRGKAGHALKHILTECPAKILLISYSSEGFIAIDQIMDMLNDLGRVSVYDQDYNTFRGCRNLSERATRLTEFLFMVERTI